MIYLEMLNRYDSVAVYDELKMSFRIVRKDNLSEGLEVNGISGFLSERIVALFYNLGHVYLGAECFCIPVEEILKINHLSDGRRRRLEVFFKENHFLFEYSLSDIDIDRLNSSFFFDEDFIDFGFFIYNIFHDSGRMERFADRWR